MSQKDGFERSQTPAGKIRRALQTTLAGRVDTLQAKTLGRLRR
jgi:hypothetical protein